MIIVWGKKKEVKYLGFVADYCVICRQIQPFYVKELGMVSHVYWIAHGDAEVVGHIGTCADCRVPMGVNPQTYKEFSPDCDSGIERLIADTYPAIREALHERFEVYEKAKRYVSTSSENTRMSVILEPFQLLAPLVEEKFGRNMALSPAATVSGILTVFAPIFLLSFWSATERYIGLILSGTSIVLGIIITRHLQVQWREGFFRRSILPKLGHSLRELNPRIQEVECALEICDTQGLKIGTKLKAEEVLLAIQEVTTVPISERSL